MKQSLLLFFSLLFSLTHIYSQVQIGEDINGLTEYQSFGSFLDLSSNGKILAGSSFGKAIQIYKESDGEWIIHGLDENGGHFENVKATSLALSGDGFTLAYGSLEGYIHVFTYSDGIWVPKGDVLDERNLEGNITSLRLSEDGNSMAYGNPEYCCETSTSRVTNSGPPPAPPMGRAGLYNFGSDGWVKIWEIANTGETEDFLLGVDIELTSDGNTVSITSTNRTLLLQKNSGSWGIIRERLYTDYRFLNAAITRDGSIVAITEAMRNEEPFEQRTNVYMTEADNWIQLGNTIFHGKYYVYGDGYGETAAVNIDLSADGQIMVLTTPTNVELTHVNKAVIYKYNSNQLDEIGEILMDEEIVEGGKMSLSLTPDAERIAISKPWDDDIAPYSGKVRVYDISNITLGIDKFSLDNIKLFPNPASSTIELILPEGIEMQKMNVFSMLDQLVLTSNSTSVDISSFSAGTYFAEIITNQGRTMKKIVVK